ncbi:MAG: multiheme c-type cytochrome [Desulfurivibrionaceae bacterium]
MRKFRILTGVLLAATLVPLYGCSDSDDATVIPAQHTGASSEYVGSESCAECHAERYADFVQSGHPYKLNKVVNDSVPTYPFSDITGALARVTDAGGSSRVDLLTGDPLDSNGFATDNVLGTPSGYSEVTYVIGGYGWKARWIDADGYIVTGTEVQYNLEDDTMGGYHDGEANKVYNCGNCHTTGWKHYDADNNPNRQDDLIGMDGTFAETGIGCEACHGAGSDHIVSGSKGKIVLNANARTTANFLTSSMGYGRAVACGECHTRDGEKDYPSYESAANKAGYTGDQGGRIASNGTTGKHHQQYDELLGLDIAQADGALVDADNGGTALGKHLIAGVGCVTCHNPHTTTKHQDHADNTSSALGVSKECLECHGADGNNPVVMPGDSGMAALDCKECHMPLLVKSAIWTGTNKAGVKVGDIKTHVFKIDLSKTAQLTDDEKFVNPWITADYACGSCHAVKGFGFDVTSYKFHQAAKWEPEAAPADFDGSSDYRGSAACAGCHSVQYADVMDSGHPYKLNKVVGNAVPLYPFSDITGALDRVTDAGGSTRVDLLTGDPLLSNGTETDNELGTPADYSEATYVIGGYGWKARWIDLDGYIVTGTEVQYNLEDDTMGGYHDGEANKVYNCGNCHTTGWKHYDADNNPNRQDDLIGMDGTFAEAGIGCEACHGAGGAHIDAPYADKKATITRVANGRTTADFTAADMAYGLAVACGECHTRDGEKDYPGYESKANVAGYTGHGGRIDSNGTIGKHHQQYDELLGLDIAQADGSLVDAANGGKALGKHLNFGVTCNSCHNPHTTTKYQDHADNTSDPGVSKACAECHVSVGFVATTTGDHSTIDCVDCHMPQLVKSAIWTADNAAGKKQGDIRSHIFKIDLSNDSQLTDDSKFVNPWITADYACGKCHAVPADKVTSLNNNYGGKMHK